MNNQAGHTKSSVNTDAYEPFMVGDKQAGEVHWLSQTNAQGVITYSGLWKCDPMTFEYEFPGDEIIHVLEGDLLIEIDGQDDITLTTGDIASFDKGVKCTWTIQNTFKKFFVIGNC